MFADSLAHLGAIATGSSVPPRPASAPTQAAAAARGALTAWQCSADSNDGLVRNLCDAGLVASPGVRGGGR